MKALLATVTTVYGIGGALAVLLQARQICARRTSCDVSLRFLAIYLGGYGLFLAYGLSIGSLTLILADGTGLVCGLVTFALAVRYHKSCTTVPTVKGHLS
jgi:uncharacterized protein with PQ loop repeat